MFLGTPRWLRHLWGGGPTLALALIMAAMCNDKGIFPQVDQYVQEK